MIVIGREGDTGDGKVNESIKAAVKRADFAARNYKRLGSSWAEFYGRDIPMFAEALAEVQAALRELYEQLAPNENALASNRVKDEWRLIDHRVEVGLLRRIKALLVGKEAGS